MKLKEGKKTTVQLSYDTIDEIVRSELLCSYKNFQRDYDAVKNGADYLHVFHADPEEDRREIKKMIKSLRRVINYYSIPAERIK